MNERRTSSLFVLAALVTAGCAQRLEHARAHHGNETMRVVNATASPICALHVASRDEHLWGPSWIEEPVAPGAHVDLPVRPDDYMLRAGRCDGDTAVVVYHVSVDDDVALVIHDGYPVDAAAGQMRELAYPSWSTDRASRHVRMIAPGTTGAGVELRVKNRCARDLRVVLGGDPQERSGSPSTLPASAVLYYYAPAGTPLWLVDERYETIARAELTSDAQQVDVTPSCDGFSPG